MKTILHIFKPLVETFHGTSLHTKNISHLCNALFAMETQTEIANKIIDKKADYIENQSHWIIDCTFAEDSCRIRSWNSPRNFALLRRIALNALNREQTYKLSLRQKMKRTGMDNDYMIQVLSSCFIDSTLDSEKPLCQA